MRRPPDKDRSGALSERDVVSSNATVNSFLGGARRPAWMVGAGAPVRPTPRANISKATQPTPSQAVVAQRSLGSILPSPAPSDEPSPILSNVVVNGNRGENSINVKENQRPTNPSRPQSMQDARHSASEADLQHSTIPSAAQTNSSSQYPQTIPASNTTASRSNATIAVKSLVHSPGTIGAQELGATNLHGPRAAPINEPQRNPPQDDQTSTTRNDHIGMSSNRPVHARLSGSRPASLSLGSVSLESPIQTLQEGDHQLPSLGQLSAISPRTPSELPLPSTMVQQSRELPNPVTNSMTNPYKRQRTQPPAMPSLKSRVTLIQAHIDSVGGMENLNNGLERPRFQLLSNACRDEDAFYVALHQVFCVWDLPNPSQITSIPDFPDANTLPFAFKILGQLIKENEGLAPNHKKWFASFPSPLGDLLRISEPYRRIVKEVGVFLGRLSADWVSFSRDCTARQYPPLVDELVHRLGLLSPTLRGVVFTAVRRNLGISDDLYGNKMEDVFEKDKRDHQALANRYNTARPPTEREIRERNQILAKEYLLLRTQFLQSRRSSASSAGSPMSQPPAPVIHNNMNYQHPQPLQSMSSHPPGTIQAPRRQNTSSPSINANWQSGPQFPQPTRMNSTSVSNAAVAAMAGRSPSIPNQQVSQNTPSPILIQNLSMQSPVQQAFPPATLRSNDNQAQPPRNGPMGSPTFIYHQNQFQSPDPRSQQPRFTTQQLQQMAAQQSQQNIIQLQQAQWIQHQQSMQQHPPRQQPQQPVVVQQQQQSQQHIQYAIGMNRTAQLRRDNAGIIDPQQHPHSRNNSISSSGRHTPNVPSPLMAQNMLIDQAARMANQSQRYPLNHPLLPPLGLQPMQPIANPDMTALHQAHLRSPILVVSATAHIEKPQDDPSQRFYQTVKGFALSPTLIAREAGVSEFNFNISETEFVHLPRDVVTGPGRPLTRALEAGTLQYRLRCIQTKRSVTDCVEPDWVVSDTSWPDTVSLAFNQDQLEIRRKYHHGKDLPIDVTQNILDSGPNKFNKVTVTIAKWRQRMKEFSWFFAVEIIEVLQHKDIMNTIINYQRIPVSKTLDAIKKSLAPSDDDDDIAMVVSDLTIDLADPFTARIFNIPVRGDSCLHRECFDLETFLLTRNSKPKRPQQPCMPDVWKCPLCSKDARPYCLRVDQFLLSVRAELESQDNLDVKAILISPDGSWRPKQEPSNNKKRKNMKDPYDDDSSDDEAFQQRGKLSAPVQNHNNNHHQRVVEVIDLDD
ncbi:hypothetical protein BGZ60DRAFT_522533 [Tricladium varicosporioides]|nr:hypothetical protein BGZ60DRAFT_522533 [Hymenoscyphus varicosporioides]